MLDLTTVGFADVEAKKPLAPDSLLWIASMNKPITGAALMILGDEGKVNVDEPVEMEEAVELVESWRLRHGFA